MTEEQLREQAWNFFQMQAGQRLTTFNFYIVISSVIFTGLAGSFRSDVRLPCLGESLGLLLLLFSFVFFKLDERNRELIKGAEETLRYFESRAKLEGEAGDVPHIARRFTREDYDTKARKSRRSWRFWRNEYSYSECFGMVFLVFGGAGLAGAVVSLIREVS
jgi:hypothetical protein